MEKYIEVNLKGSGRAPVPCTLS